ncbi:MAG: LptF/LptG family permease [Hydrotalea flava]|nr:LptF/LptG family permease [Hydrotalea flava]
MIKKLDILVVRAFIGPFLATFLIALFVLVMQFFWLYIDDLVGKGIDFGTLAYLTGLVAITWVPLALPLALLLSSIMTFGNMGESFEIVAIKAAGIPLLRFMRPLLIVTIIISGIAFLFANNIIPVAQLKLASLQYDIIVAKPAFDIKEGVFYNKIEGNVIKLGKKESDDSTIKKIVIFKKTYGLQDNLITAESGVMKVTPDKKFLEFKLKDGYSYEEKGPRQTIQTDFTRTHFNTYTKLFDLSTFQMNRTKDSAFIYDPKMLSVRQLNTTIDSLENLQAYYLKRSKIEINPYLSFAKYMDSTWPKTDTGFLKSVASIQQLIPDSERHYIEERSLSQLGTITNNVSLIYDDYKTRQDSLLKHEIEWHRKFTLSVACIVLFLIGAPLGSIIRKGGLGTPLVFAIVFFVLFHLLNTFGEKFAKSNVMSPLAGMWLSTLVLIPIGFFLTFKAMRDSQLFNQEFYYRTFKEIRKFIHIKKTEYENKHQSAV